MEDIRYNGKGLDERIEGSIKDERTPILHIQAIHRNNTILTLTLCENCLEELEREIKKWINSHHTSEIF